jgi:hypothetical protein
MYDDDREIQSMYDDDRNNFSMYETIIRLDDWVFEELKKYCLEKYGVSLTLTKSSDMY